ncbi:Unconventional myosin-XV [Collichthys lucidus]|uniref:Unconventional myosin-XV n=1 Tax=Collichthys lucidus TaxID=240159 RepID=A0A4U5VSS5_COLLU|nr:Unconventional myosin-XV [Collichthys lucidus]
MTYPTTAYSSPLQRPSSPQPQEMYPQNLPQTVPSSPFLGRTFQNPYLQNASIATPVQRSPSPIPGGQGEILANIQVSQEVNPYATLGLSNALRQNSQLRSASYSSPLQRNANLYTPVLTPPQVAPSPAPSMPSSPHLSSAMISSQLRNASYASPLQQHISPMPSVSPASSPIAPQQENIRGPSSFLSGGLRTSQIQGSMYKLPGGTLTMSRDPVSPPVTTAGGGVSGGGMLSHSMLSNALQNPNLSQASYGLPDGTLVTRTDEPSSESLPLSSSILSSALLNPNLRQATYRLPDGSFVTRTAAAEPPPEPSALSSSMLSSALLNPSLRQATYRLPDGSFVTRTEAAEPSPEPSVLPSSMLSSALLNPSLRQATYRLPDGSFVTRTEAAEPSPEPSVLPSSMLSSALLNPSLRQATYRLPNGTLVTRTEPTPSASSPMLSSALLNPNVRKATYRLPDGTLITRNEPAAEPVTSSSMLSSALLNRNVRSASYQLPDGSFLTHPGDETQNAQSTSVGLSSALMNANLRKAKFQLPEGSSLFSRNQPQAPTSPLLSGAMLNTSLRGASYKLPDNSFLRQPGSADTSQSRSLDLSNALRNQNIRSATYRLPDGTLMTRSQPAPQTLDLSNALLKNPNLRGAKYRLPDGNIMTRLGAPRPPEPRSLNLSGALKNPHLRGASFRLPSYAVVSPQVQGSGLEQHWAQGPGGYGLDQDMDVWGAERVLPDGTVQNFNKWSMYRDGELLDPHSLMGQEQVGQEAGEWNLSREGEPQGNWFDKMYSIRSMPTVGHREHRTEDGVEDMTQLDGVISGAITSQYLLEKSRIVFQAKDERNYHIFYEMLAGLPSQQKQAFYLQGAETYYYLNQGGDCGITGKNDAEDFLRLRAAMEILRFTPEDQSAIYRVLSSILHLGNVYFQRHEADGQEVASVVSAQEIRVVAELLQISPEGLQKSITFKVTETMRDKIYTPLTVESAVDARDAVAKILYSLLFHWLTEKINTQVYPSQHTLSISILDIYGFEDLAFNSFEQLCINYANEYLQFFFNRIVFREEQEEYSREQIPWQDIPFSDNQPCIDLIAAKPHGILRILDDQSFFPQATDHTFLQKCHYHHGNNPLYQKPKMPVPEFAIKHFAGRVTYQVYKFLDKNHDQVRQDVLDLFIQSKNKMVSNLFLVHAEVTGQQRGGHMRKSSTVTRRYQMSTVSNKFQQSLLELVEKMERCNPFFVRCIKPNNMKKPGVFEDELVSSQLRHSGIYETIRIRREGYPVRMPFDIFLFRYKSLVGIREPPAANGENCVFMLSKLCPLRPGAFHVGVTKMFLKEDIYQLLECKRERTRQLAALTLQRYTRMFFVRKRFLEFRKKFVGLQARCRGFLTRKRYVKMRESLVRFRSLVHMYVNRKRYIKMKFSAQRKIDEERRKREMELAKREVVNVTHLVIPAELGALLQTAGVRRELHSDCLALLQAPHIQEQAQLTLPLDINNYPFYRYVQIYFREPKFGMLMAPLESPLTRLEEDLKGEALQLFNMVLRFMGDPHLNGAQENMFGNYIIQRGLSSPGLRDEILAQVVNQVWRNMNVENAERGWLLLLACVCSFAPSPKMDKYLLKFVSDKSPAGCQALLQHRLIQGSQKTQLGSGSSPETARTYPLSLLEWTANRKKANMVLHVHCFDGGAFLCPVHSWTSGEDLAGDILRHSGFDSDEELSPAFPLSSSGRPAHSLPDSDGYYSHESDVFSDGQTQRGMDRYLDSLFDPVLSDSSVDMEKSGSLTTRMKGGGGIGITGGGRGEGDSHAAPSRPFPHGIHPGAVPVLPVAGGMMPPVPTMPIPSHHHHHEQHQLQEQQQQYHQYNRPTQPYQQLSSSTTAPATPVAPTPSPTRAPAATTAADIDATAASHVTGVSGLPGAPSLPATTVVSGLPGMSGVPGSEQTVLTQQQQAIINQQAIILAQQMTMQAIAIQQQMLSSFPPCGPSPPVTTLTALSCTQPSQRKRRVAVQVLLLFSGKTSPTRAPPPEDVVRSSPSNAERIDPSHDIKDIIKQHQPAGATTSSGAATQKKGDGKTFAKKPDPHDEAMEILKDQMANPPQPTPKKPPSSKPKEEGGLKVSKTTKSRPAGSTSSNISPAPPQVSRELPVEEEIIQTQLHSRTSDEYYTYSNVPWKLYMRKEGSVGTGVQVLSVSHKGIKLLKMVRSSSTAPDYFRVLRPYSYLDILFVSIPSKNMLEFNLTNEKLILFSAKAPQVKHMIDYFLTELKKDSEYVVAVRNYINDDRSLLNFHKGDIIKLQHMDGLEAGKRYGCIVRKKVMLLEELKKDTPEFGWRFGAVYGRSGVFPSEHVHPVASPDFLVLPVERLEPRDRQGRVAASAAIAVAMGSSVAAHELDLSTEVVNEMYGDSVSVQQDDVSLQSGQYHMAEFAKKYFREAQKNKSDQKVKKGKEGRDPVDMVKFSKSPIQESLIDFSDSGMNRVAADIFIAIMKFMGDFPLKGQTEQDLVTTILKLSADHGLIKDEAYCQVMKQVTANTSSKPDSCQRGWRLLYILTAYHRCSDVMKPFVLKFLQDACATPGMQYQGIANACEQNLRRTFQYGGRIQYPNSMELKAMLAGRSSKRQLFLLPGGIERHLKIKTCSVALDVIEELCYEMGLHRLEALDEYAVFLVTHKGQNVRPLNKREYILDIATEAEPVDTNYSLWFRRVIWSLALKLDNELYVTMHYNQVLPDYLKALLTVVPQGLVSAFPMFGSSFFYIQSCSSASIQAPCILAVNLNGLHFLNKDTHGLELCRVIAMHMENMLSVREKRLTLPPSEITLL